MAKVIQRKMASLNLGDFIDKKPFDVTEQDIQSMLEGNHHNVHQSRSPSFEWKKEDPKPYALEGVIEQIKSSFDVGKEVEQWSAKYYAPAIANEKGKPTVSEITIPPIQKGMGGRFIICVGTREVPTLEAAMGSTEAKNQYLMLPGDCIYLKITVCPILNISFSNNLSEKLPPRKGFREMTVKKNPFARHILVVDAHVAIEAVAKKVKDELIGVTSEEVAEKIMKKQSNIVAEMASKKS